MKYTIILSTYNWPSALDLILANLIPQLNIHKDTQLIIADDGSTADTKKLINSHQKQLPGRIHHVWHEDNGFRKSMILNKAVAVAIGDYLLFLDGDCIPFPDYITQHKKLAQAGYFVAGNRVLVSKEHTTSLISNKASLNQIFSWGLSGWVKARVNNKVNKIFSFIRLQSKARWRYARATNWKYPKGCNIGMFKADFIAINGYDEIFNGWGHEDADLFIRLLHNNIKIKDGRYSIPVLHLWHKESSRVNEETNYSRLMTRLQDKNCIFAEDGFDKYKEQEYATICTSRY
ncbi:MAG: glycosyl transferase family 2 [Burkholderiales bacterium]|jgi:glycosyltransferase involved in cell wall biosynthesis|nr:glycosyl transferase family 2 [Burkholderiales bacterium]